jgi:rubrerythrin
MAFLQAADAIELAMGIEKNGEAFYRAVAQKAGSVPVRALFQDLAEQEVRHYATFARLSKTIRDKPLMGTEEWGEYQGYLQDTVQSALFEGPDKALAAAEQVADEKEAMRMAMSFEKETILFFYNLRDVISGSSQDILGDIITEEKTHVRRLARMLLP